MNKDVIYIDVEDDITAVIGKVKDAKEKIVALVPPKRIGVLQSAVNLRLLARAAEQNGKHLVLISSNSALVALAAAAKVPVAKNLQSKPELAEIAALDVDNGEDVIDGSQLPVGELARTAGSSKAGLAITDSTIDDVLGDTLSESPKATPPALGELPKKPKAKSGIKVPNFNTFRKKLVLIVGGGVLLVALLIWGIFFAPHATVVITARTTDTSANPKVALGATMTTDATANTIKSSVQEIKKDASVSFDATGSREVGEKSQGQVVFKNCETPTAQTVPAGTAVSANGRNYITQAAVTVSGASGFLSCSSPGSSAAVAIAAQEIGEAYNTPSNTTFTVAGHPGGSAAPYFNAVATTDITGGSKKTIKTVSASDVQKATDQLAQQSSDDMKKQLKAKFGKDNIVIDQSFTINRGSPQSAPAVDQEIAAGAQAKLTASIVYSLSAIPKGDMNEFLTSYFNSHLDSKNEQRVYDNGVGKVSFANVAPVEGGFGANVVATAKIGPKIDDEAIKNEAKGKRYGEIQTAIETIQGVDNVDIKFWPFWVSSAPNDTKKISVEFNLNESK